MDQREEQKPTKEAIEKFKNVTLFQLINVPLDYLTPVYYNPRKITDEKLKALQVSIKEDPEFLKANHLIVNTFPGREGFIIAGEQRWKAAKNEGYQKVPVMFVKVNPNVEKAWNAKHNTPSGEWDEEKRKEVYLDLHTVGYDMNTLGFAPNEMVDILADANTAIVDPKDDPENKGTTPKGGVKAAQKIEFDCPSCGVHLVQAAGSETAFEVDDKEDETA